MLQRPTPQQEPKVSLGQQSAEDLSNKAKTTDIATRAERFTGTTIGRRSFHQDQNNHENHKAEHRKKFHFGSENYLRMMHLSS
jgi:hypothetical protein